MPYYQTLKYRREDLGLSVQNVADQTRLKPEFIRAIEEHNLDLFSDDFSYVRYFVHAYCDAIGVNWTMIKDEVDADVSKWAHARDQALYDAQVRMIQTMPSMKADKSRTRKTRRKRKASFLENSAGSLSRKMSWGSSKTMTRLIVIGVGVAVGGLLMLGYFQNSSAQRALEQQRAERTAELEQKEIETRRLADDLKSKKDDSAKVEQTKPVLKISGLEEENSYDVRGYTMDQPVVHISFYAIGAQTVTITWNGVPAYSQAVSGAGSYDLQAGGSGQLVVTFQSPSVYNALSLDDTEIPANYTLASPGGGSKITLNLIYSEKAPEENASLQASSEQPQQDAAQTAEDPNAGLYEDPYADPNGIIYEDPAMGYGEEDYTAPIQ